MVSEAVNFRDTETNCSDNYKWNVVIVSQRSDDDRHTFVTCHDVTQYAGCHPSACYQCVIKHGVSSHPSLASSDVHNDCNILAAV